MENILEWKMLKKICGKHVKLFCQQRHFGRLILISASCDGKILELIREESIQNFSKRAHWTLYSTNLKIANNYLVLRENCTQKGGKIKDEQQLQFLIGYLVCFSR